MDPKTIIEVFGTLASIVVAISLTMKNIKRLRIFNLVGAAMFTTYGVLIGALPVWLLNGFIVFIDLWYLYQLLTARSHFKVMKVDVHSDYTLRFLDFHKADIARFSPDFSLEDGTRYDAYFILRDMIPVGLIIASRVDDETVRIALDYSIPNYRDMKNSEFFFAQAAQAIAGERPIRFLASSATKSHARYLERMGFAQSGGHAAGTEVRSYEKLIDGSTLHGF
jgi:hypothetical protein